MEAPVALYRYVTEGGYRSKLYTMGGLKQVLRSYNRNFARYSNSYYDTSKWVIERIPIKVDKYMKPESFLETKALKVFWEFTLPMHNYTRAYLRAMRSSAWEAFRKDVQEDLGIDADTCAYYEKIGDIDV